MSEPWSDLLRALSAATAVASAVMAARAARMIRCGDLERSAARLCAGWLPERVRRHLHAQARRAGLDIEPAGILIAMQVGFAAASLAGAALVSIFGASAAWVLAFAFFGAAWPLLRLRDRIRARHHRIARALPYDLDLLTLSVEAGLDFTAAIAKVVEKGRPGPLADELSVALKELKLGKMREEALKNLARRCDLPMLTTFVQALIHADRLGTPLGKTLRLLSTQMRVERTHRAEKLANEAPVKLLLPLIGCIFPTIFLMLFAPIFYQVFLAGEF